MNLGRMTPPLTDAHLCYKDPDALGGGNGVDQRRLVRIEEPSHLWTRGYETITTTQAVMNDARLAKSKYSIRTSSADARLPCDYGPGGAGRPSG